LLSACGDDGGPVEEADAIGDANANDSDAGTEELSPEEEPEPIGPPTLEVITPNQGAGAGGIQVTATGRNFVTPTTVLFGTVEASTVRVIDEGGRTLSILVPRSENEGLVDVTVQTRNGSDTLADAFTYLPGTAPVVTHLEPARGNARGGESIRAAGRNLPTDGRASVIFGGTPAAEVTLDTDIGFDIVSPAHEHGDVDVTINFDGDIQVLSEGFTFVESIDIDSIAPSHGPVEGGSAVLLFGGGFIEGEEIEVLFGDVLADPEEYVLGGDHILVVSPAAEGEGPVDITAAGNNGEATVENAFLYETVSSTPELVLDDVLPNVSELSGGIQVELFGDGLELGQRIEFFFGDGRADPADYLLLGDRALVVVPPAEEAGTVNLRATGDNGESTIEGGFIYGTPIEVESFDPEPVPLEGGEVTLTGTGIVEGSDIGIEIGNRNATGEEAISDTQIVFDAPTQDEAGVYDVLLEQDDMQILFEDVITYGD
jgi:hypothetical protein